MTRKLSVFVLLLAIGLGVLHFAIGWENFAPARAEDHGSPIPEANDASGGFLVDAVDEQGERRAITFASQGELRLPRTKPVTLPSGEIRRMPVYILHAQDSRPHPDFDDQMLLDDVDVELFEVRTTDAAVESVRVGRLDAARAVVQVGRDAEGRPSVREDRDIDLTGVTLVTDRDAPIRDLRMTIDRVLVRNTDAGFSLVTPDQRQPFHVEMGGDDPMDLTGEGLSASLPARTDGQQAGVLELHIAARPVLVRGGATASAMGPLDYVEDAASGVGSVVVRDAVELRGDAGLGGGAAGIVARGDVLRGWLARDRGDRAATADRHGRKAGAVWQALSIVGDPACLETDDTTLFCRRLEVTSGVDGRPAIFTAVGSPRLEPRGGTGARFTGDDRIHLVQVRDYLGAIARPFGFPTYAGALVDELVVFEGACTATDADGAQLAASLGMRILRSGDDGGPAVTLGAGAVKIVRDDLVVESNRGFLARQVGERLRLRLGPASDDPEHAFAVTRTGERAVDVRGHGACTVLRDADGSTHLDLRSTREDLVVDVDEGHLRRVGALAAQIGAGGELESFTATGDACSLERTLDGDRLDATAREIRTEGRTLVLRGTPAVVARERDGSVAEGTEIRVTELGSGVHAVSVSAEPGSPAARVRFDAPAPADDGRPVPPAFDLYARHVDLWPFLLPAEVLALHAGSQPYSRACFAPSARGPWLIARGEVDLTRGLAGEHARGDRLLVRTESPVGILTGAPARIDYRDAGGTEVVAVAETIRFSDRDEGLVLFPTAGADPIFEFVGQGDARQQSALRRGRAVCRGEVRVERAEVTFDGPVRVQELDANREIDPDGIDLVAGRMVLRRKPETGEIVAIEATKSPTLCVQGVVARGDVLRVDLPRSRCTILAHHGEADVLLPGGKRFFGAQLDADYTRMLVTGWRIRVEGF